MNVLSSILNFIANKIGNVSMGTSASTLTGAIAETFLRTRSVYGKGSHTVSRLYGVYGYKGTGNQLSLFIPLSVANDVSSISFSNLVASIRTVSGDYAYPTNGDMSSIITSQTVINRQPIIVIRLESGSFNAINNTPVIGEVTAATFTLS